MEPEQIKNIAEEIIQLYVQHGADDYVGEPVSQLEHMSQCAQLAQQEGYGEDVILAAFLHDIGHICSQQKRAEESMDGFGVIRHEKVGADFLRSKGFSERVARLVESHVPAKRYLTFKDPEYYNQLSEASKQTLEFQGGRMTAEEAAAFEADDLFNLSIRMRRWDELGKETDQPVVELGRFKEMFIRHLASR
ncbi:phosphohydrolase [Adhaeribacter arboris]|uniref:Phosphohydrolase n=1 Tax=Adhaeribacter arboris TaxID=2072846 RepID=A0A2T2YK22_9BACT|nr:phosphonate degradation HD-domain oxygenase [Adhaeribacter arboris]PSR55850.1 phosphohydrolase [Adhaeribacter arboris]